MKKIEQLISHLQNTFHIDIKTDKLPIAYNASIPVAVKAGYEIAFIAVLDQPIAMLFSKEPSIKSIKKHLQIFEEALSMPVVFSSDHFSPSMQQYLVDEGIPFISEQSIYLPKLFIYLKKVKSPYSLNKNSKLSKLAQVVLIALVTQKQRQLDINSGAKRFNVSKMSMSRALNELAAHNYLSVETSGRKKNYTLIKSINIDKLFKHIRNPVMETIYLKEDQLQKFSKKVKASFDALSVYTNITNHKPIFAMEKHYFHTIFKENSNITLYDNDYDTNIITVELWRYDPLLIQENIADMISLYLSIQDKINKDDNRMLQAIEALYQKIEEVAHDTRHH